MKLAAAYVVHDRFKCLLMPVGGTSIVHGKAAGSCRDNFESVHVLIKHISAISPRVSAMISTLELHRHSKGNKDRWAIAQCTLWVCSTFRQIVALNPARLICSTNIPLGGIQASFLLQLSHTSTLISATLVYVIHHPVHGRYCPS